MASGHVNRTNRPNTWLHRPATRREDSPCQLGAVHTWHIATENQGLKTGPVLEAAEAHGLRLRLAATRWPRRDISRPRRTLFRPRIPRAWML